MNNTKQHTSKRDRLSITVVSQLKSPRCVRREACSLAVHLGAVVALRVKGV